MSNHEYGAEERLRRETVYRYPLINSLLEPLRLTIRGTERMIEVLERILRFVAAHPIPQTFEYRAPPEIASDRQAVRDRERVVAKTADEHHKWVAEFDRYYVAYYPWHAAIATFAKAVSRAVPELDAGEASPFRRPSVRIDKLIDCLGLAVKYTDDRGGPSPALNTDKNIVLLKARLGELNHWYNDLWDAGNQVVVSDEETPALHLAVPSGSADVSVTYQFPKSRDAWAKIVDVLSHTGFMAQALEEVLRFEKQLPRPRGFRYYPPVFDEDSPEIARKKNERRAVALRDWKVEYDQFDGFVGYLREWRNHIKRAKDAVDHAADEMNGGERSPERMLSQRARCCLMDLNASLVYPTASGGWDPALNTEKHLATLKNKTLELEELDRILEVMAKTTAPRGRTSNWRQTVETLGHLPNDSVALPSPGNLAGVNESQQVNEAVFKREGLCWRLTFEGESGTVPDQKGFSDLAIILRWPNTSRPLSAAFIRGIDERELGRSTSAQNELDSDAKEIYLADLVRYRAEREKALIRGDEEEACRLETLIEGLNAEVSSAHAAGGRQRDAGPRNPGERLINTVREAIRRAIAVLRKPDSAMIKLADHLDESINTDGGLFTYRPKGVPPNWSF